MAPKAQTTTSEAGKTTHTFKLSEAEVREQFAKIQAQREAQKARRMTPEFKAQQAERNRLARERKNYVLAQAEKLGLK